MRQRSSLRCLSPTVKEASTQPFRGFQPCDYFSLAATVQQLLFSCFSYLATRHGVTLRYFSLAATVQPYLSYFATHYGAVLRYFSHVTTLKPYSRLFVATSSLWLPVSACIISYIKN